MKYFNKAQAAPIVAEFLGTALLVMVAIVMSQTTSVSYFIATSLAVTLALVAMFFGPVSGAHVNPGVTFGLWIARKIGTIRAIAFIVAQLLGGLASWQLFQYLIDKPLPAHTTSFNGTIFVAELVGTAIWAMGVAAVMTRVYDSIQGALTLGAAVFTGVMVAAIASAGYINPAIALGVRNFSGVYILGPLVGGLIGVNLYTMLFAPTRAAKK